MEAIKTSAKVYLITREWWKLEGSKYGEGCGGGYYWRGWFEWDDEKERRQDECVFGFSGNYGQIDQYYNCTRPKGTTYKKRIETLSMLMLDWEPFSMDYREYSCNW